MGWKQTEEKGDNRGEETEDTGLSLSNHKKRDRVLILERVDTEFHPVLYLTLEFLHRFPTEIQE